MLSLPHFAGPGDTDQAQLSGLGETTKPSTGPHHVWDLGLDQPITDLGAQS